MSDSKPARALPRTIASLRLNIDAAMEGRVCELLPEGFRDKVSMQKYPLPSNLADLQAIACVPLSKYDARENIYLRRAIREIRLRSSKKMSALSDIASRRGKIAQAQANLTRDFNSLRVKAEEAVANVQEQAAQAVASLTDLFALGRRGLEAQMQAHLAGEEHQGERISAAAFRDCFRMVTQAVKGLGLPSDQRDKAAEAIMQEVADSLESTREAVAMAAPDDGKEH